jgi:tetratricopeptide (TPR) repeat protein
MKLAGFRFILLLIVILTAFGIGGAILSASAQQTATIFTPSPTPTETPVTTAGRDLESRIERLEIVQAETINSLTSINEHNRFLFSITGFIITILVGIQSYATYIQLRREKDREERQARRDSALDQAQLDEATKVTGIMSVVQQTLESRLLAEQEEREKAQKLEEQLRDVANKFERLDNFYQSFQSNIRKLRTELEQEALQLARLGRHDFRGKSSELNDFTSSFDQFMSSYKSVEEGGKPFTARVLYIRGIAAHYLNQPEIAEEYLKQVVSRESPESSEEFVAYNRRKANSYYYLGLNGSNFGRYEDAIKYFEAANSLDSDSRDFLTKAVIVEAYVMSGDFLSAGRILSDVETRMQEIEQLAGKLRNSEFRLKSRIALMKANILILKGMGDWKREAKTLLLPVHDMDPSYYYATATLAQLSHLQGDKQSARELFQDVYDTILTLADIHTIREVRSKVLLLMIAGMAAKYIGQEKQSKDYLDQAVDLCSSLPTIDAQICTVFSTFTKRNESSDTIKQHIDLIRRGEILVT